MPSCAGFSENDFGIGAEFSDARYILYLSSKLLVSTEICVSTKVSTILSYLVANDLKIADLSNNDFLNLIATDLLFAGDLIYECD